MTNPPGYRGAVHTPGGLFDGVFSRGEVDTSDQAWLQAMLDTEAALARALEAAGRAAPGAGAAVTAAARADRFDLAALGEQAARTGNPVPALARELARRLPPDAAAAVHQGATSQDIIDTAAMLLARQALAAVARRPGRRGRRRGPPGRRAPGHADDRPDPAAAGRAGHLRPGRGRLADRPGRGARPRWTGWRPAGSRSSSAGPPAPCPRWDRAGPEVAALLAAELGLAVPTLPWHTDRLRIIEIAAACAGVTGVLGKIARDVTLLAQSEVGEVRERGGDGRGGSSAMPHKQNPVAAIAVLGCTQQVPGLVATLVGAAEQEHQRAAGAWHAEWEPLSDLLRLTGSAASWTADLLTRLVPDPARMRANLDAAGGFPMAEHVAALLAPALGRAAAHDLVAQASARAAASGQSLRDGLLDGLEAGLLAAAGVTAEQVEHALDPAGYLGAAGHFVAAALAAHTSTEQNGRP